MKSAAAPIRRPQRAAATSTKSYKEPDTDESQSESERVPICKVKDFSVSPYITLNVGFGILHACDTMMSRGQKLGLGFHVTQNSTEHGANVYS